MTNIVKTDIDIDVKDRDVLLEKLKHIPASIINKGEVKKHNTGVYFTDIPVHPFTNTANIDYKEAEDRGYFKLDILNVNYDIISGSNYDKRFQDSVDFIRKKFLI